MTPDDLTDAERVLLDRLQELDDGADLWDRLAERRGAKLTPHLLRQRMAVLVLHYGDAKAAALAECAGLLMPTLCEVSTRKGTCGGWPRRHARGHFGVRCEASRDVRIAASADSGGSFVPGRMFKMPEAAPSGAETDHLYDHVNDVAIMLVRWTVDVLLPEPVEAV